LVSGQRELQTRRRASRLAEFRAKFAVGGEEAVAELLGFGTCPECNAGQLHLSLEREEREFTLNGVTKTIVIEDAISERCDACGQGIIGPLHAQQEEEAICKAFGVNSLTE